MKRTPLKRSGFRRKVHDGAIGLWTSKKPATGLVARHRWPKKVTVHWKPPAWFMVIPAGSHGSNPVQKRLWKLTSDFVRICDFETHGACASCCNRMESWQDGHCGHYKAWSVCNNYFKYDRMNLSLQCPNCNRLSDGVVGTRFGMTLRKRHGDGHLDNIESKNKSYQGGRFESMKLVDMARELVESFRTETNAKPDYYEKVIEKIEDEQAPV